MLAATATVESVQAQQSTSKTFFLFFVSTSEHANGERRGPVADPHGTEGRVAPATLFSDAAPPDSTQPPSAIAVGMPRKSPKIESPLRP